MSDLQQALLPLITECKLTRNNTTSIYRYTIVLSYICALIRSCIRSHTVVMLSGARRPCVHLGCVTPAARCKFYLQLPLGSSILSYHCERLTRQFGIVTQLLNITLLGFFNSNSITMGLPYEQSDMGLAKTEKIGQPYF